MGKKASKQRSELRKISKSGEGWPILCLASQLAIEHSQALGINARLQISLQISRALSFVALVKVPKGFFQD